MLHWWVVWGRGSCAALLAGAARRLGGSTSVGVLVSGPESLEASVAAVCRAQSAGIFDSKGVALNFHSVSFSL